MHHVPEGPISPEEIKAQLSDMMVFHKNIVSGFWNQHPIFIVCLDLCVCLFSGKYTKYKVGKKFEKGWKKFEKVGEKLGKKVGEKLEKSWKKVEKNGKVKKKLKKSWKK